MNQRFQVTDMEVLPQGRVVVGVNFWEGSDLTDSPDLWFDTVEHARSFFTEAQKRGWTRLDGALAERHEAALLIAELARTFGGDWWSGGPFWFDREGS